MRFSFLASALIGLATTTHAATVEIDFALVAGSSTPDPFILPNPSGNDFTVVPTATVNTATMTVSFQSDESGIIGDGDAFITDFDFTGSTNLRFTNGAVIFGQVVFVNLAGPLTSEQVDDATGMVAGLATYTESGIGAFDTLGGPTTCSGNFANAGCGVLTGIYGTTFPLPAIPSDDAPLPITNASFTSLNTPGSSTAANSIGFSLPIGGGASASLPIDFTWTEANRTLVIPEPGATGLALFGAIALIARRHRAV